jgi:glycerol-3-phosphate O-acyltransferase
LEEWIAHMLKERHILEYHIERRRERSGKIKHPEQYFFENYVNVYLRNEKDLDDVLLVPITVNYDKIYEGEQFPYELLGEEKPN